jgi:hypothetical protein
MKKPAFRGAWPLSFHANTNGAWFRVSVGILLKVDEFIVFEDQRRRPGEPEPAAEPAIEAVFPLVGIILDLFWVSLHVWFILPVGIWLKQTAEEAGLDALREFARKGFDAPFPVRTGNTKLHPRIPPEDPTHPQSQAKEGSK